MGDEDSKGTKEEELKEKDKEREGRKLVYPNCCFNFFNFLRVGRAGGGGGGGEYRHA